MKRLFVFVLAMIFFTAAGIFSQSYYQSGIGNVPEWAKPGSFRFLRIDAGPIEVEKAKLSNWGLHFTEEDNEVLAKVFDRYSDNMLYFLKKACFDWVWVTYSNGFSIKEETINRALCEKFLKKCHNNGIKVSAYFSMTNMFWVNMFVDEPQSVKWLNFIDGKPQVYGSSNVYRFQADINNPGWRNYILRKLEMALEAGFDGIFFDNLQADIEGIKSFLTEVQNLTEKFRNNGFKPLVYVNAHLPLERLEINDICDKVWNEFANSAVVSSDLTWNVDNVQKTKYILASIPLWKPHCTDMTQYLNGSRESVIPLPKEQKLGIAEARAFGSAMGKNIEGPFIRALIKREKDALDSWDAVSAYNIFTKNNSDCYTDVICPAKTAVIAPFEPDVSKSKDSFDYKLQSMLIKNNVPIDIIPVNRIKSYEKIKGYKVIILTDNNGINTDLKKLLKEYLDKGGKVLSIKGVNSFKSDNFIYLEDSEKERILKDGYYKDFINRLNILSGKPQIIVEGNDFILANLMMKTDSSKMFVHVVNYNEKVAKDVKLKILINPPEFKINNLTINYKSPDNSEFKIIKNNYDNIEIAIHNLDTYGVVIIQ